MMIENLTIEDSPLFATVTAVDEPVDEVRPLPFCDPLARSVKLYRIWSGGAPVDRWQALSTVTPDQEDIDLGYTIR